MISVRRHGYRNKFEDTILARSFLPQVKKRGQRVFGLNRTIPFLGNLKRKGGETKEDKARKGRWFLMENENRKNYGEKTKFHADDRGDQRSAGSRHVTSHRSRNKTTFSAEKGVIPTEIAWDTRPKRENATCMSLYRFARLLCAASRQRKDDRGISGGQAHPKANFMTAEERPGSSKEGGRMNCEA